MSDDQMKNMPGIEGTPNPIANSKDVDIGVAANTNEPPADRPSNVSAAEEAVVTGRLTPIDGGRTD